MRHRTLGSQGLEVSAIGYGWRAWRCLRPRRRAGGCRRHPSRHDLGRHLLRHRRVLRQGTGNNEVLLRKTGMDFRDEVVLATKFGFARLGQGLGLNSHPDNIRARSSTSA